MLTPLQRPFKSPGSGWPQLGLPASNAVVWTERVVNRIVRNLFTTAHLAQGYGSMPMRSLTADRIRCLQPR